MVKKQADLDKISEDLKVRQKEDQTLAGGSKLIPFLLSLNMNVLHRMNFKWCFWGLLVIAGLFYVPLPTPVLMLLAGFFAIGASYVRPDRPSEIALAPLGIDVFLGRPMCVSEHVPGLHSNNNVSITTFQGRYVLAYRQSDFHFPSGKTRLIVASSDDLRSWRKEWTFANGCDLRETLLFQMKDKLFLYFFSLMPKHDKFIPIHIFYVTSSDAKTWSAPAEVCRDGEVPWEIKVHGQGAEAVAYKASYLGDHYGSGDVLVLFEQTRDGVEWEPVAKSGSSIVYSGGISEVAFEFTQKGDLVAIGRNEDGDATGFGSQLFFASRDDLGSWTPLRVSIPLRFDSPRMTITGSGEVLLFARYAPDHYQLAPGWLPFMYQKTFNLIFCSLLSKSAAVYRIAPHEEWGVDGRGAVQLVRCFENTCGDTGFFSLVRELSGTEGTGGEGEGDRWVVANYASSHVHSHAPWFIGQMRPSHIYVCRCRALSLGSAAA